MQPMSLVVACMQFFGRKPDQSPSQFAAEFKELTEKDKVEIQEGLEKLGYAIKSGSTPNS